MNITLGQAVLSVGSASPLVQFTCYCSILYRKQWMVKQTYRALDEIFFEVSLIKISKPKIKLLNKLMLRTFI